MKDASNNQSTKSSTLGKNAKVLPHHLEDLQRSGLSDETIEALGFYSATADEVKSILGFEAGPGLVIPYPTYEGQQPFTRVKPNQPRIINGKKAKYLSPKASQVRAYIPKRTWEALKESKNPIIITEGEKKTAKTDQEGVPCIGLGGVWAFYQEHRLIPDMEELKWQGRPVTTAFDSDVTIKPEVKESIFTLERELLQRGAEITVVQFEPASDGSKVGLDDFLVTEGPEALKLLLEQAKSALAWEIDDCAKLAIEYRIQALRDLFKRLARLEPIELEYYRSLCLGQLGIPRHDFQAQLREAKGNLAYTDYYHPQISGEILEPTPSVQDQAIEESANSLLRDPVLLYRVGAAVQRLGVAGEDANIRLLYLAVTSRILNDPLSITLKGDSASGKSYTAGRVLMMFPHSAYLDMTGMSRQALVYMEDEEFAHRTLVVYERSGAEVADYNVRTLQSEGKLIFYVAEKNTETNKWETRRVEKEGPTNFVFTTTSPELHPENETRHWSLIMDESPMATLAAKVESAKRYYEVPNLTDEELKAWARIQELLKPLKVRIPYARWLAEHTPNQPLRMRRDFNKLLTLIEIIALLYQYQRNVGEDGLITASIADYFMARELVNKIFPASLAGINDKVEALICEVERLYQEKLRAGEQDPVVKPAEIALALSTSASSVSRWLRPAIEVGMVDVVAETANGRIKSVRPGLSGKLVVNALPTTEKLAESFPELASGFRAVHPLTGEELVLEVNNSMAEKNI